MSIQGSLLSRMRSGCEMRLICLHHQSHSHSARWSIPVLNSLAPGKFEWNFRHVIFKQISMNDGWGISCEIALIWFSLDFTDEQSTLVQVMSWCRQATSQYLSQCWPRSMSPYGVTRPQWVDMVTCSQKYWDVTSQNTELPQATRHLELYSLVTTHNTFPAWTTWHQYQSGHQSIRQLN